VVDSRVALSASWLARLDGEFSEPYMQELRAFLVAERKRGKTIYPRGDEYFAALDAMSFERVRVVILGQDPYHGPGQAHGLCFSVREDVRPPPSLLNIFREIIDDLDLGGFKFPHGALQGWADQGVLLLNSVLTVEKGRAASHQGKGWERFTDQVVNVLNAERSSIVFMLWGAYAQKKGAMIDRSRHLVLTSPHPSPLSASRGFFGCKHFSMCNAYLQDRGVDPIDWARTV